jgi:putative PIN family toxin of toxin-antitoxin system
MKVERAHWAVIDTNVWISAALSGQRTPGLLVQHILAQGAVVFSAATFQELQTRLWKPKFDRYLSADLRRQLLHDAAAAAVWVEIPPPLAAQTYSRDPQDDMFIHTALAAGAPWLVTGDDDLLAIHPAPPGLHILTPAAALQWLKSEPRSQA